MRTRVPSVRSARRSFSPVTPVEGFRRPVDGPVHPHVFDFQGVAIHPVERVIPIAFPHARRIGRLLGIDTPLDAVLDPAGCHKQGARAFTEGKVTHFSHDAVGVHIAAHEAAHQLQHAGVTRDGGLGPEGHAAAVADAVARGSPAHGLVTSAGEPVPSARRNYVDTNELGNPSTNDKIARLADTGESLTMGNSKKVDERAYATPTLIKVGDGILEKQKSGITMYPGPKTLSVQAPDGSGEKTLSDVKVIFEGKPNQADFYGDCREAARTVMGNKAQSESATARLGGSPVTVSRSQGDLVGQIIYLQRRIDQSADYGSLSPDDKLKFQKAALNDYEVLDKAEKEALKKPKLSQGDLQKMGIDQFAAPEIGEAYAGFKADPVPQGQFQFHYATVVMKAGQERITLENQGGAVGQRTTNWKFETYGSPSMVHGRTFHDDYKNTDRNLHTLVVKRPVGGLSVSELIERYRKVGNDPMARASIEAELVNHKLVAQVEAVDAPKQKVFVSVRNGASRIETGSATVDPGSKTAFLESIDLSLLSVTGPFDVSLYSSDFSVVNPILTLTHKLIGSFKWDAPYRLMHAKVDGYSVMVGFT